MLFSFRIKTSDVIYIFYFKHEMHQPLWKRRCEQGNAVMPGIAMKKYRFCRKFWTQLNVNVITEIKTQNIAVESTHFGNFLRRQNRVSQPLGASDKW